MPRKGSADGYMRVRMAADEQACAEERRAMIAGARAKAKDVTLDGREYKLVRLPPSLRRAAPLPARRVARSRLFGRQSA